MFAFASRRSLIAAAAVALLGIPTQAGAAQLVVGFERGMDRTERDAALDGLPVTELASIAPLRTVTVDVPDHAAARVETALERRPGVRFAERDVLMQAGWTPNDPKLSNQWGIARIGAPAAWDVARADPSVVVAVVDSGVDASHADLSGRVIAGRDHVDGDADPSDEHGHGTHVAGIAAASTDNGIGIAGTAPGATILSERVLDASGSGYMSWIAAGIVHAADNGADVINLSLSGSTGTTTLHDAIVHARSKGAVVVCAAGNDSATKLPYPAAYAECVTVGSTDSYDRRSSFSNTGTGLDLMAPGSSILSTVPGGYSSWSGTSMATPFVAGAAALLVGQGHGRDSVEQTLAATARDLGDAGYDTSFGHGIVQADAAVQALAPTPEQPTPTEEPAPTEPAPSEPAPSEPAPSEPAPSEPAPLEPVPTEPAPVNSPPTCTSSSIVASGGTRIQLQCTDAEGSPLRIAIGRQPKRGRLSAVDQSTGTVTYTPKAGGARRDSFTFLASDGQLWSASASVSIQVRAAAKARLRTTCVRLRSGARRCTRMRAVRTTHRTGTSTRWVRVATFTRR